MDTIDSRDYFSDMNTWNFRLVVTGYRPELLLGNFAHYTVTLDGKPHLDIHSFYPTPPLLKIADNLEGGDRGSFLLGYYRNKSLCDDKVTVMDVKQYDDLYREICESLGVDYEEHLERKGNWIRNRVARFITEDVEKDEYYLMGQRAQRELGCSNVADYIATRISVSRRYLPITPIDSFPIEGDLHGREIRLCVPGILKTALAGFLKVLKGTFDQPRLDTHLISCTVAKLPFTDNEGVVSYRGCDVIYRFDGTDSEDEVRGERGELVSWTYGKIACRTISVYHSTDIFGEMWAGAHGEELDKGAIFKMKSDNKKLEGGDFGETFRDIFRDIDKPPRS